MGRETKAQSKLTYTRVVATINYAHMWAKTGTELAEIRDTVLH